MDTIDLAAITTPPASSYPAKSAWFRREAILGRKEGDLSASLRAWADGEEVDLAIHDAFVSRRHARLFFEGKGLFIQDLGSANKTWIDDIAIPWAGKGNTGRPQQLPDGRASLRFGPRALLDLSVKRYQADEVPGAVTSSCPHCQTRLLDPEYVQSLRDVPIQVLIAAAPVENARLLVEYARNNNFPKMTVEQILAVIAEKRPEAIHALYEEMKARTIAAGHADLLERERQQWKQAAERQDELFRFVLNQAGTMHRGDMDAVKGVVWAMRPGQGIPCPHCGGQVEVGTSPRPSP